MFKFMITSAVAVISNGLDQLFEVKVVDVQPTTVSMKFVQWFLRFFLPTDGVDAND